MMPQLDLFQRLARYGVNIVQRVQNAVQHVALPVSVRRLNGLRVEPLNPLGQLLAIVPNFVKYLVVFHRARSSYLGSFWRIVSSRMKFTSVTQPMTPKIARSTWFMLKTPV